MKVTLFIPFSIFVFLLDHSVQLSLVAVRNVDDLPLRPQTCSFSTRTTKSNYYPAQGR